MDIEQIYELTTAQSGILYHCISKDSMDIYLEQFTFLISNCVSVFDIATAWNNVIKNNEILRGSIRWKKLNRPIMVIEKKRICSVEVLYSSQYSTIQCAMLSEREKGIDIEREAIRICIYRNEDLTYMIVTTHHVFLDGWSSALILNDFIKSYEGNEIHKRHTYHMFASRSMYKEDDKCTQYWQNMIGKLNDTMLLPCCRESNQIANAFTQVLDAELSDKLQIFLRENGILLSTFVYAAWSLFLGFYNTSKVVFGVTISGRERNGAIYDDVAGVLINTVPFIMEVSREKTVENYLNDVAQQQHMSLIEYGNMSLEKIAACYHSNHEHKGDLFNTLVVIENYPLPSQSDVILGLFDVYETTHYDITLQITNNGSNFELKFLCKDSTYSPSELRKVCETFTHMINMLVANSGKIIARVYEELAWEFPKSNGVNVCASCVSEPMKDILSRWLKKFRLPSQITFMKYNSAFINHVMELSIKPIVGGTNIALLCMDDLIYYCNNHSSALRTIDEAQKMLVKILNSNSWKNDTLLCLVSSDLSRTNDMEVTNRLKQLEDFLLSTTTNPLVRVLSLKKYIDAYQPKEIYDVKMLMEYHIPFTDSFYAILAVAIVRAVVATYGNVFKVIVTDCDNTLWKGICGEQVDHNMLIDKGAAEVQKYLLELKKRGFLLCINSRNNEQDVWSAFESTPSMLLSKNDFVAYRIHWGSKSEAMLSLAKELNLALESFIFLDDSIAECVDMSVNLPQVLTLLLPDSFNGIKCLLTHMWAFDRLSVDKDDVFRSERYQQERHRQKARKKYEDENDYLVALKMKAYVNDCNSSEIPRMEDLSRRVTQFTNVSGALNIPNQSDSKNMKLWCVYFEDVFGEYGLVGGVMFGLLNNRVEIYRMYLSCRSIGRRLEYFVLQRILKYALKHNVNTIHIKYEATNRNSPFHSFIKTSGLIENSDVRVDNIIENVRSMASMITSIEIKPNMEKNFYNSSVDTATITSNDNELLSSLHYPDQYLKVMEQSKCGQYIYPIMNVESMEINESVSDIKSKSLESVDNSTLDTIMMFWRETINCAEISQHDSFFKIGGTSIKLAMLANKMSKKFGVEISLVDLFEYTTPIQQARYLNTLSHKSEDSYGENNVEDTHLLSPLQYGIYIGHNRHPEATIYNVPVAYIIDKQIDFERMEFALRCTVLHHASMRLQIKEINGDVIQTIENIGDRPILELLDWSHVNTENLQKMLSALIRPFDIMKAPIFRSAFIRLSKGRTIIFFDMHHIAVDGFSMQLILKDIVYFYENPTKLEKVEQLPFYDYTKMVEKNIYNDQYNRDMIYWLKQTEDADLSTNLGFLIKDDSNISAARISRNIIAEEFVIINQLMEMVDVTPYIHCLATLGILLYTISAKERIYIATPLTMRDIPGLENTVGLYINTLPLCLDIEPCESYHTLLYETKKIFIEALNHRYCTMDKIARELGTSFRPVNIMLTFYDNHSESLCFDGLRAVSMDLFQGCIEYDMVILVTQGKEGLNVELQYKLGVFDEDDAQMFLDAYVNALLELAKKPYECIKDISLVNKNTASNIIEMSRGRKKEYPSDSLIELFCDQCKYTPEHTALIHNDKKITYAELDSLSDIYARNILSQYNIESKFVIVCMEPSIDQIAVLLAIWKCGGAFIPIHTTTPQIRVKKILKQSRSCAVITDLAHIQLAEGQQYLNYAQENVSCMPLNILQKERSSDIAYAIFTSGTTGQPKGCVISHGSIANAIQWRKRYYGFSEKEVCLQLFDFSFDGFFTSLFTPLISGACCVICDRKDAISPAKLCMLMEKWKITHVLCVPTLYSELIEHMNPISVQALDKVVLAGEIVPQGLVCRSKNKFPKVTLFNEYGPTENSVVSAVKADLIPNEPVVVGTPIDNVSVYILGATKQLMQKGLYGDVYLEGKGLLKGYFGDDGKVYSCLIDSFLGQLYGTGDIGRWTKSGELVIIGRKNQQKKVNGYRVDLVEIDKAISEVSGVQQCKTVLVQQGKTSHLVANYIGTADQDIIVQNLKNILPEYMIPKWYRQIEKFPVLRSGKTDISSLESLGLPIVRNRQSDVPLKDERYGAIVECVRTMYEKVLSNQVCDNDNFFELGGNSITAVELSHLIETKYGCGFAANDLYELYTVEDVACKIFKKLYGIDNNLSVETMTKRKEEKEELMLGDMVDSHDKKGHCSIEPYNNELYIDCFFAVLFSLLKHVDISIDRFLLNFCPIYMLSENGDLTVGYQSDAHLKELLLSYGIIYDTFGFNIDLIKTLEDIHANDCFAIMSIDRYYMPFKNSILKHQLHYLLIDHIDHDGMSVSVIDQIANESLKYAMRDVSMQNLVEAFQNRPGRPPLFPGLAPLIQVDLRNAVEHEVLFSSYINRIHKMWVELQSGIANRDYVLHETIKKIYDDEQRDIQIERFIKGLSQIIAAKKIEQTLWSINDKKSVLATLSHRAYCQWKEIRNHCVYKKLTDNFNIEEILKEVKQAEMIEATYYEALHKYNKE